MNVIISYVDDNRFQLLSVTLGSAIYAISISHTCIFSYRDSCTQTCTLFYPRVLNEACVFYRRRQLEPSFSHFVAAGLVNTFSAYGPLTVEWPGKDGKHPRCPPKGNVAKGKVNW